jgi:hypothetical protein
MTFARIVLGAVCLAGCDHVLDLRVEAETLCVPAAMQTFSGGSTKLGPLTLPGTSTKTVSVDFSKALAQIPGQQAGLKLDVRLDQVFIRSTSDLVFVKQVKVSLAPGTPSDALPPLYVGEYVKGAAMSPVSELKVQSTLNANVIKYLQDEPAKLMFTATGNPPGDAFMANIEACVFVQGHGDY